MSVDDVSEVLDTGSALYILAVTDDYTLPDSGEADLSSVPASLTSQLADELASSNVSAAESEFAETLVQSDLVTIYPMPEGLPYYVDMA
jgi:hypothetical protein